MREQPKTSALAIKVAVVLIHQATRDLPPATRSCLRGTGEFFSPFRRIGADMRQRLEAQMLAHPLPQAGWRAQEQALLGLFNPMALSVELRFKVAEAEQMAARPWTLDKAAKTVRLAYWRHRFNTTKESA